MNDIHFQIINIILSHHKRRFHSKNPCQIFFWKYFKYSLFIAPWLYKSHGFHREPNLLSASIFQVISQHIQSSEKVNMTRSCSADSEYISHTTSMFFSKEIPAPECSRSEVKNPCFMYMEIAVLVFLVACFLTVGRSVMSDSYGLTVTHRGSSDRAWLEPANFSNTKTQVFDLTLCSNTTVSLHTDWKTEANEGLDVRLWFRCANASFCACLQLVGFWYVLLRGVWV